MKILIALLGLVTLWDGATTVLGTMSVIGSEPAQVAASMVFALIITVVLLCTSHIINSEGFYFVLLIVLWITAVIYDLRTSYYGNETFLLSSSAAGEQEFILFGMSLLVSGAPLLISFIINEEM